MKRIKWLLLLGCFALPVSAQIKVGDSALAFNTQASRKLAKQG